MVFTVYSMFSIMNEYSFKKLLNGISL